MMLEKKEGICHTILRMIFVELLAAAASTRVAQVLNEDLAHEDVDVKRFSIFDL